MGKLQAGALGGFSGKVGPVVGSNWNGINCIRSLPGKPNHATINQLAQRAKFALASTFISSMRELLDITFRDFALKKTGANSAQSFIQKNAIVGDYPDLRIDHSLVLISRGDLPNAVNASAISSLPGEIIFSWADNSGTGKAKADDKAILVAYCEELNQVVYIINGALRSLGSDTLEVPTFRGRRVQTWLSFITKNGKDVASSLFTGELIVV